jgi:ankyrin repeat protein
MADILDILLQHSPSSINILQPDLRTGRPNISLLFRAIRSIPKLALMYIHGSTYETALESTMSTLIRWGAKTSNLPVEGSSTPLHMAVFYGEHDAAEIILQNGTADLEVQTKVDGLTPLLVSICQEDEKMFSLLCRHGANINSRQRYGENFWSALHLCALSWHTSTGIAKGLLEYGIEIDYSGDRYSSGTALVQALMRNLFDLANVLIAHGSSLGYLSEIGERGNAMGELLFILAHRQTFYAVKFLVEHARVSVPFIVNPRSSECVFHAICGTIEVRRSGIAAADFLPVFRLLRHKFPETSHINFQNCYGLTPLHDAVYNAYPAAVEALLANGADPTVRSSRRLGLRAMTARALGTSFPRAGKTPLEMVQEGIYCEIPDHVKANSRELAVYIKRREDIIDLFSPYLS